MKRIKLADWARQNGVSWRTAYRYFKSGKLSGVQLDTGTILVDIDEPGLGGRKTVVYARVSNSGRRNTDLEYQAERLVGFCVANGWVVDKVVKEVGSGLNDKRPKLEKVLSDPMLGRIVVEHKDRLTRFGYNFLEILAEKQGFEIIVVNPTQDDREDLLEDFTNIITSFCARIYGQRRGKRKTEVITAELNNASG